MKGVTGLPEFLFPQAKTPGSKSNTLGLGDKISFGNFFQRWVKDSPDSTGKQVISQKEENLLLKSLEKLIDISLLLVKGDLISGDAKLSLKDILEKINLDQDFILSLPEHLKALFYRLRGKESFENISARDIQGKDELVERWLKRQDEKQQELLLEIQGLIAAIRERLFMNTEKSDSREMELRTLQLVEINARYEKTARDQASLPVSNKFINAEDIPAEVRNKINQYVAQMKDNSAGLSVSQRLALVGTPLIKKASFEKSLLNQISDLIKKVESTAERFGFKNPLTDLKAEFQAYFEKNRNSAFYREDQFSRNQYQALRESTAKPDSILQGLLSEMAEKNLKAGDKEVKAASWGDKKEEISPDGKTTNFDLAMVTDLQKDGSKPQTVGVRPQPFYQSQAEQIFQQMVEGFKLEMKQGISQMEIKLYPEELGRLMLKITMEDGVVSARFITETGYVKDLIEHNLPQLKETMAKEGIHWHEVTVDVGEEGLTENPFAYQGEQQLKEQRKNHSNQSGDYDVEFIEPDLAEGNEEREIRKNPERLVDYLA